MYPNGVLETTTMTGADTDHMKACDFTRSICLIYIKSGNIVRKLGENRNIRNMI